MRYALLLPLATLATACTMDTGFHKQQEAPPGQIVDTGVPFQPPIDTGSPPEDSEPPPPDDSAIDEPPPPVADCQVSPNPVTPPFEAAAWDGSASYDPSGGTIVDWDWQLVSYPSGSAVTMPPGDAIRSNFVPDMAGDYVGQLVVTNDAGNSSEPCTVTLESIPAENMWIEMYWVAPYDDMDLHLVRANGNTESNQDCYYANCVPPQTLNWGSSGSDDNPSLDLDDIPGSGPENINIGQPESTTYTVYVHDYSGSNWGQQGADTTSSNDVTVNIYLNGTLVWSDTRGITGENKYTAFAEINWAAGTVTSL